MRLSFYLQYYLLTRTRAQSARTSLAHTGTFKSALRAVGTCFTLCLSTKAGGSMCRERSLPHVGWLASPRCCHCCLCQSHLICTSPQTGFLTVTVCLIVLPSCVISYHCWDFSAQKKGGPSERTGGPKRLFRYLIFIYQISKFGIKSDSLIEWSCETHRDR